MDITQLILDDHHEQRRLFAIIEQIDTGYGQPRGSLEAALDLSRSPCRNRGEDLLPGAARGRPQGG